VAAEPDNEDIESLGLLEHLDGRARQERAELITWLLDRGFDVDQIRNAFIPMLLPANRAIGDDGTSVSAREVSESNGVSLELLQRLHRAAGLVHVENPDALLRSRADAESVLSARVWSISA
jgi:adenylate cyclase